MSTADRSSEAAATDSMVGSAVEPDYGHQLGQVAGVYILQACLLYTSPSPRDGLLSRMPSSA